MFKTYLKTAWRNLLKNKFYSALNIIGLAIGLAVGIMILLWVQSELSYDAFHTKASNIYKINSHLGSGSGAQVWSGAPSPLALIAKNSVPGVVNAVRIRDRWEQLLFKNNDKTYLETKSAYVDPSFFSIFSFKLLKGNADKPFNDDNSIIVTSATAIKFFGTDDVVGKVLANGNDNFVITGVLQNFPDNSTINYNILFPLSLYAKNFGGNGAWKTIDDDLGNYQYNVFLQLQPNVTPDKVAQKMSKIFADKKESDVKNNFFTLQSLTSMHLITADGSASALQTVRIFIVIATLILIIACINYVNLSTARSMLRAKEVSMRKIIGASKQHLFFQFIVESFVLFLIATIVAIVIIYALLPLYNNISGKQLALSFSNTSVLLVIAGTITGTLILGSIYPALLLISFKPLQVLKGKLSVGIGTTSFRKVLVITQFAFSVILILGTIVITRQLQYIKQKDLGFDKTQVFSFALNDDMHQHYDAARNDLLKQHGVIDVAASDNGLAGTGSTTGDTYWEGKEEGSTFLIHPNGIDQHFIPLLKMQLVAGHNFTGSPADSANIILNETAVKQAGIQYPIGKKFTLWQTQATIIGVVKDFNYASLKQAIEPSAFYFSPPGWVMYVKTTGNNAAQAVTAAKRIWTNNSPGLPFQYTFLDDDFNKLYQADEKSGLLMKVFATVAILISCLGLFGLITFTAEVKTKEIGIRKVLGASVLNISAMLSKEFLLLVTIAFIIAAPLAWWGMNKWLLDFAYRINIEWWMFLIAAAAALLIALLTVSLQSIKAAIANPVKSLRTE